MEGSSDITNVSKLDIRDNKISVWSALRVYLDCTDPPLLFRTAADKLEQGGLTDRIEMVKLRLGDKACTPMVYAADLVMVMCCVANGTKYFYPCMNMFKTITADSQLIRSGNVAGAAAAANHVLNTVPAEVRKVVAATAENPTGAVGTPDVPDILDFREHVEDALSIIRSDPRSTIAHTASKVLKEYRLAAKRKRTDDPDHESDLPAVAAIEQAIADGLLPCIDPTRSNVPGMPGVTIAKNHPMHDSVMTSRVHTVTYFFASYLFGLFDYCNDTEWAVASILCKAVRVTHNGFPFNHHDWLDESIKWKEAPYPILPVNLARIRWSSMIPDIDRILDDVTIDFSLFRVSANYNATYVEPCKSSGSGHKKKLTIPKVRPMCGFSGGLLVDRYDPIDDEHAKKCPPAVTYQWLYRIFQHRGMSEDRIRNYVLVMLRTFVAKLPFNYIEILFGDALKAGPAGVKYLPISEDETKFRRSMVETIYKHFDPARNAPTMTPMAIMNLCLPDSMRWEMGTLGVIGFDADGNKMDYRLVGRVINSPR